MTWIFPVGRNMFKIMVDGKEHSRYDDEWVWINVGSAAGAEVRLPWAAGEHLKIYPMRGRGFLVSIHDPAGMTHTTTTWFGETKISQRFPDRTWKVHVRDGDPMIIRGHEIRAMKF